MRFRRKRRRFGSRRPRRRNFRRRGRSTRPLRIGVRM